MSDASLLTLADGLSREFLLHRRIAPLSLRRDGALIVAATPDADEDDIAELGVLYAAPVIVQESTLTALEQVIERLAAGSDQSLEVTAPAEEDDRLTDARTLAGQAPVVRYVNLLIREAFDAGASDIHLEATRSGLSARLRLDGVLGRGPEPPAGLHHAIVSRVKLMARLDIAERRRPQDGRIRLRLASRDLEIRVSTTPTLLGESVVLRLLERGGRPATLADLGLELEARAHVQRLASRAHGMVLATGPTGSGKTTTLYAALQQRDALAEKIMTIEDPVEYELPGITQIPVHREAGVTFASSLRSMLRQDPDVMMIGEMRDHETATLAVQAAMTGHLVFATLHTNDAIGALPRLVDLGVPAYLLAATIEGVLAQRLVRRICDDCRVPAAPPPSAAEAFPSAQLPATLERGAGCGSCRGTGFKGRAGLFELLLIDDDLREQIARNATRRDIEAAAQRNGMRTLREDGWAKVLAGVTTVDEVLRVTE